MTASKLKEMKTIVRPETVADIVEALKDAGVPRIWVSHVHSIGTGVDPEDFRLSFEDGGSYMKKARIEFLAEESEVERLTEIIRDCGGTGHRGDGVVVITDVASVVNVRTGDEDKLALL